jgi:hypothetical protein
LVVWLVWFGLICLVGWWFFRFVGLVIWIDLFGLVWLAG